LLTTLQFVRMVAADGKLGPDKPEVLLMHLLHS